MLLSRGINALGAESDPRGTNWTETRCAPRLNFWRRRQTPPRSRRGAARAKSSGTSRTRLANSPPRVPGVCPPGARTGRFACGRWLSARGAPPRITASYCRISLTGAPPRSATRSGSITTPWTSSRRDRFARRWCFSPRSSRRTCSVPRARRRAKRGGIASWRARFEARDWYPCLVSIRRIRRFDPSPRRTPRCYSCRRRTETRRYPRADRAWRASCCATRSRTCPTSRCARDRRRCRWWPSRIRDW